MNYAKFIIARPSPNPDHAGWTRFHAFSEEGLLTYVEDVPLEGNPREIFNAIEGWHSTDGGGEYRADVLSELKMRLSK